jgi:hypothetical protein
LEDGQCHCGIPTPTFGTITPSRSKLFTTTPSSRVYDIWFHECPQHEILGSCCTSGTPKTRHSFLFHVPMLFFPILTEQYFWAKNYQYHTHTPYLDKVEDLTNTSEHVVHVAHLISSALKNKSSPWLKQQQHNLQKYNGTKQFVSFLEKIIQKNKIN